MILCDGRGKATSQRVRNDARQRVGDHIESFPKDHNHYSRESNPNVQFLSMDLNIKKIYELYTLKCEDEGVTPVKESFY